MRDVMLDCDIEIEYGQRVMRPVNYAKVIGSADVAYIGNLFLPGAIVEVDPKNMPTNIARHVLRCDYCGHPPGDGRHKCLNCGAPK